MNPARCRSKRRLLLWAGALAASRLAAQTTPLALPSAHDLQAEVAHARAAGQPLVVMVSLEHCPFCRVVREQYLGPMQRRGEVQAVQLDMRSAAPLRNARGEPTTHDAQIRTWQVKVAPTLLFLGPLGLELADRLEGASIPDFYSTYLDQRLELARQRIKSA